MTTTPTSTGTTARTPREHRLRVPGAELHYEVRGSGPLLLTVAQPMTSGPFAAVADLLAAHRTVVTYDPRGVGRSTVDDPARDVTPEDEADDLAAVVDAVGGGPADVLGSSGGGVAALALAVRHPGHVRTVVAHEPPLCELLEDAPHLRDAVDAVQATYRAAGAGAAWGAFVSLVVHEGPVGPDGVPPAAWPPHGAGQDGAGQDGAGQDGGDPGSTGDPAAAAPPRTAKDDADDELFFLRMLVPFTRWHAPVEALRDGTPHVVPAVGATSGAQIARRATDALADRLGTTSVVLPGGHAGFMEDPEAFATALLTLLASR
ncbi:alpha/beta fold hydrolase [Actinotalea solisilvae]|uniref:alpha/beta fold hydrolase n=1 Tax=Actinotalea solisilvae TaxID=2072922 RepID=UPI0018F26508|nr:alpha/beta hydrolase [Actinotalea solisilvae]